MNYKKRIDKWLVQFRKYLFFYRDGYYELPYLSNSPQIMLESLKKMPFTKYDAANNYIESNNPFTDGIMHFRELEEGLWIMITEIEFKKNVSTHALYDNEPCEYYFLSYFRFTHQLKEKSGNEVSVPKVGWCFYKPGSQVNAYFGENDKGVFMDICFNKAWFDKNIPSNNLVNDNSMSEWLLSNNTIKRWTNLVTDSEECLARILDYLKQTNNNNNFSVNHLPLKIECLNLVMRFVQSISTLPNETQKELINETDRRHLATAERMLLDSLTTTFPGINQLAKAGHMSPTKLKTLFNKVYGNSILQYYQEKQMILALELFKTKGKTIKDVAHSMGYIKASNFTIAFKKYHQFLPSDIK